MIDYNKLIFSESIYFSMDFSKLVGLQQRYKETYNDFVNALHEQMEIRRKAYPLIEGKPLDETYLQLYKANKEFFENGTTYKVLNYLEKAVKLNHGNSKAFVGLTTLFSIYACFEARFKIALMKEYLRVYKEPKSVYANLDIIADLKAFQKDTEKFKEEIENESN